MTIPTTEPKIFTKGETVQWTKTLSDYPSTLWTLVYYFRGRTNGFNVTCTNDGTDFVAEIPDITDNNAGVYQWQAKVSKGSQNYIVGSGTCEILEDLSAIDIAGTYDGRLQSEIDLAAVKEILSGKASKDVQEYAIGNRQLKHIPIADLIQLKRELTRDVINDKRARAKRKGTKYFKSINVRLNNA